MLLPLPKGGLRKEGREGARWRGGGRKGEREEERRERQINSQNQRHKRPQTGSKWPGPLCKQYLPDLKRR